MAAAPPHSKAETSLHSVTAAVHRWTPGVIATYCNWLLFSFREKPYQTTAVALGCYSLVLHVIATFTPWISITFSIAGVNGAGWVSLTDVRLCTDISNPSPTQNDEECRSAALINIASSLNYLYTAGASGLALLIIAFLPSTMAIWLTRTHRNELQALVPVAALRHAAAPVVLHLLTWVLLIAAFAQYSAVISSQMSDAQFSAVFIGPGLPPGLLQYSRTFGGGFAITIVAAMFSITAMVLFALQPHEVARTVARPSPGVDELAGSMGGAYASTHPPSSASTPGVSAAGGFAGGYNNDDASQQRAAGTGAALAAAAAQNSSGPKKQVTVGNPFQRALSWTQRPAPSADAVPAWGAPAHPLPPAHHQPAAHAPPPLPPRSLVVQQQLQQQQLQLQQQQPPPPPQYTTVYDASEHGAGGMMPPPLPPDPAYDRAVI